MNDNWKECERKGSWPNLRYCPGICLIGLWKTTKDLRRVGLAAEIGIGHLSDSRQRSNTAKPTF
jgi:hypothetical protein